MRRTTSTSSRAPSRRCRSTTPSGKFLRGWGKDIKSAHHIKIDHEGNVWIADIGNHIVQKYTPEGKLLLTIGTEGQGGPRPDPPQPADRHGRSAPSGDVFVADGYGNARVVHLRQGRQVRQASGASSAAAGPVQHRRTPSPSIPRGGSTSPTATTSASRSSTRTGKFLDEWKNLIVPWGFHVTKNDEIWVCGSSPMQWRKADNALGCPPKDQVFMKFNADGQAAAALFTVPKGLDGLERPGELNWVHCIAAGLAAATCTWATSSASGRRSLY